MQDNHSRRLRASWLAIVAFAAGCVAAALSQPAEAQRTATITYFDEPLDPYGYWVDDPYYGRVWRPRDPGPEWRPYTYGRWVYTSDYGWVWVSDEPWGWVVYHYGHWVWTSRYGWVWVPGDEWAPAWVEWCTGGGYIGWAPMPPDPYWQSGYYYGSYQCGSPPYYSRAVYVRESTFASASVSAHVVAPSQNAAVARGTVNVTNYGRAGAGIVNRSIDVKKLQAATGQIIRPVRVVQSKSPIAPGASFGAAQELRIYRPVVRAAGALTPPPLNPNLKLDPDLAGVPPAGAVSVPPLDSPGIGSVSPSTNRIGAPPLDAPSIGGGPSLGNPVGSTIGTVRGRLGR
jgi:hypothetical protein